MPWTFIILFCITFDLPSLAFGSILLENWWDFRVLTHTIALYTLWVSSECRVSEHRPHTLGDFVLHPYFLILTDFRMQYTFSIWITLPSPSWLLYQLSFRLLRGNERSAERPRHFIHESSLLGSKIKQKTGFWCNNSLYFFSSVVCNLLRKWHYHDGWHKTLKWLLIWSFCGCVMFNSWHERLVCSG